MLIGMQVIDSEDTLLGRLKMSPLLLEGQAYPFTWKIRKVKVEIYHGTRYKQLKTLCL